MNWAVRIFTRYVPPGVPSSARPLYFSWLHAAATLKRHLGIRKHNYDYFFSPP